MPAPRSLALLFALQATATLAQNLHPSPDFNDPSEVLGWTASSGRIEFQADDGGGCPLSGSLQALGADNDPLPSILVATGPCVEVAEGGTLFAFFEYQGSGGWVPGDISYHLRSYAGANCEGSPVAETGFSTYEIYPWVEFYGALAVPAGGSIRLELGGAGDGVVSAELDRIVLSHRPWIFHDDFEGGATCRWSSAVP